MPWVAAARTGAGGITKAANINSSAKRRCDIEHLHPSQNTG
jgi:hypothetical protein